MAYKKPYKKTFKPFYAHYKKFYEDDCFDYSELWNYKIVICNELMKEDEVNAPSFSHGYKLKISNPVGDSNIYVILKVNNTEKYVNENAICISPKVAKKCGYDFNWDIVMVEVV